MPTYQSLSSPLGTLQLQQNLGRFVKHLILQDFDIGEETEHLYYKIMPYCTEVEILELEGFDVFSID
jgi:hypothetical protein